MAFAIDLSGRTALVTGGGQGVGHEIATYLGRAGATVLLNDLLAERAEAAAAGLRAEGVDARAVAFDVTDHLAALDAVAGAGVDILVNNAGNAGGAGFGAIVPFVQTVPDAWEPYLRVNLYGVMHCTHAVLPSMIERGWGRVITIISDAGRNGEPNMAAYAAAKAGAAGFARSIAHEVARHGITSNCIALGTIRTPVAGTFWDDPDNAQAKAMLKRYLVRRPGDPADVAGMALYLASDLSGWVTGQTYPVNGGLSFAL